MVEIFRLEKIERAVAGRDSRDLPLPTSSGSEWRQGVIGPGYSSVWV